MVPLEPTKMSRERVEFIYTMGIMNCLLVCAGFMKTMFFMRISEKFGLLVDLVAQALVDSVPFTVFLIMWLLLFSTLF